MNHFSQILLQLYNRAYFAWFKSLGSTGSNQIVFVNDHAILNHGHSNIEFWNNNTLNVQSGTIPCVNVTLSYNTWYHAGAVRSNDSTYYYLNGNFLCAMPNNTINSSGSIQQLIFGSTISPDRFFNGIIAYFASRSYSCSCSIPVLCSCLHLVRSTLL